MKTLEQFLTENIENGIIDFSLRAMQQDKYNVTFYIHANGKNSDTLDFIVNENAVIPIDNKVIE